MAERIEMSRAGLPVAFVHDRALHSRYDPQKEAEKFVESLGISTGQSFFILIEPGLGYMIPCLRRLCPGAGISVLHASGFLAEKQAELFPGASVWKPGTAEKVRDFLEREIPELPAEQVKIIEWRPALDAFGETCVELLREAAEFLRRNDAGSRSAAYFGRRWVKNFFRNLSLIQTASLPVKPAAKRPWIVAAAGPSLEQSAGEIAEAKRGAGAEVLAVSAAWPALAARGVESGAVLASDGGNWALFHLYELCRAARRAAGAKHSPLPLLAVSVTAALPPQCAEFPLLVISDGSLWQERALAAAGIPHLIARARGTVSAQAVDLALALTDGPVAVAGMDFGNAGVLAHARPYALDRFYEDAASRLRPAHSGAFSRAALLEQGGSFRVYAEWFKGQLDAWPPRVFSLGKNHSLFRGRGVSAADLSSIACPASDACLDGNSGQTTVRMHPVRTGFYGKKSSPEARPAQAAFRALEKILSGAQGDEAAMRILEELGPLVFPGEKNCAAKALRAEIQIIAERSGGPGHF